MKEDKQNQDPAPSQSSSAGKMAKYLRRNAFTILLTLAAVTLWVSPDAKAWVLTRLMSVGLFKAEIDQHLPADQSVSDFTFEDENGGQVHTSLLRGKVVFINFWASWCPPCRAEFPSIEKLYGKLKDNPDVFFLALNADSDSNSARAYLRKENFSIPFYKILGSVPGSIYSGTLPTTVVLDKTGKVRLRKEGFANYGTDKFFQQIHDLINE